MHSYWKRVNYNTEVNIKRHGIHGFMQFPEVQNTMLVMDEDRAKKQLAFIEDKAYLDYDMLLKDSCLGDYHPQKIQSLYHIFKFIEAGGKLPKVGKIVEFGPGVGCIADIILKSGFKGKYYLQDSETFNKIQKHYLEHNGSFSKNVILGECTQSKIDLLIATWSLSEVPVEDRACCEYSASQYLLAYGDLFNGELDNSEYFNHFSSCRKDVNWVAEPFCDTDQKYLFGLKNKATKNEEQ
jgi:hypothetical protein